MRKKVLSEEVSLISLAVLFLLEEFEIVTRPEYLLDLTLEV